MHTYTGKHECVRTHAHINIHTYTHIYACFRKSAFTYVHPRIWPLYGAVIKYYNAMIGYISRPVPSTIMYTLQIRDQILEICDSVLQLPQVLPLFLYVCICKLILFICLLRWTKMMRERKSKPEYHLRVCPPLPLSRPRTCQGAKRLGLATPAADPAPDNSPGRRIWLARQAGVWERKWTMRSGMTKWRARTRQRF